MEQLHAHDRHQNVTEHSTTLGHWISHKKYTSVPRRNLQVRPGYVHTCCRLCGGGMDRWKHSHSLFRHALAPIAVARRDWSNHFNMGTTSQAAMTNGIDRLPCGYPYKSSHWIGKSMRDLCPIQSVAFNKWCTHAVSMRPELLMLSYPTSSRYQSI